MADFKLLRFMVFEIRFLNIEYKTLFFQLTLVEKQPPTLLILLASML